MDKIYLITNLISSAENLPHRDQKALDALRRRAEMIIRNIFGSDSKYLKDLNKIDFFPLFYPSSGEDKSKSWDFGKDRLLNLLNTILEEYKLFGIGENSSRITKDRDRISKRIFVVHGHDEAIKQTVARVLEKLGLEPIILLEKPNEGKTLIEKFETHSDVGFAVVLLTPDDRGASNNDIANLRPRARQNVILELGYFIGKLGRNRVCVLYGEGVDIPSDIHGVLYVPIDKQGAWIMQIAKEIKQSGIEVDLNKAI